MTQHSSDVQQATLGGGCFWCIESAFIQVRGILDVESGYSGGTVKFPTYKQVCEGNTGHAEVAQISYDPKQISYREILEIFYTLHDPTQLNRQGNDIGEQYRGVIFYHDNEQRQQAEQMIAELTEDEVFAEPIVTQVEPLEVFYPAEQYHKDYYRRNPENAYCQAVISPKLAKFRKTFAAKLK
ncbi:peptide-methionine (S)-S-oxide reductase [Idiomarina tyrosinivorans]|uniref:Peptide methionine sulfoxide reductase MsrA n=1 Tax=Idiomarina tyrosinivorans TaxID=1445662 RepID=A0A432ZQX4_9GAMM|nr:peptide-methionine (S)-S-oxide reductase MsrA [Idiomarina tyrosinivorans]RUO80314.1 peptide-methionine (S)-S-oxide reductase [Idiomarina tyrosinivorans]